MEEKELKEEKEEKSEEKQNEEKEKEKEKEEDEDEDDISVIIGDQEGGIHQVPLLVAASMTEVWKQVDQQNNPSSTTIQMGMTKEILMHVLLYQRCCVCHHVKVLEEIKNAREILESKVKEDPNFAQSMQDAALAVASDSLTLFLECCNNLASFETLPEIESKDRTDAFSRQAERAKAKKPFFTTLQPLSTEEEEIMRTVNVGSVTWVGANGPPKEEDLSFSWLNPKKEDPPAQIQANKIIENELHDSETIVQHLEEVL